MTSMTQWLDRNRAFAEHYQNTFKVVPPSATIILTCADARVDPAHILGVRLGEATVLRGPGARVTANVEQDIGILWTLASQFLGRPAQISLAIIQHTDCGFERLAIPAIRSAISQRLGIAETEIAALAVADHHATLQADIERLRQSPFVPENLIVSGYIYHVEDGLVREVYPPQTLSELA